MTEKDHTDQMEDLLPGNSVTLENGKKVMVRPIVLGQLKDFSRIVTALAMKSADVLGGDLSRIEKGDVRPEDIIVMVQVAFEEVMELAALVTDLTQAEVTKLNLGDGAGVLSLVLEQNLTESSKKNLASLWRVIKRNLPSSILSSSSSTTGTPLTDASGIPSDKSTDSSRPSSSSKGG